MFGAMMKGIAQDFVKYVMHVQVVRNEAPAPAVQNVQQTSSDDAARRRASPAAAAAAAAAGEIAPEVAATAPRAGAGRAGQAADRRQGRVVEDPAQRAVPVRQRQEVQDVPRRSVIASRRATSMRDFSDDLKELRRRLGEAEAYLQDRRQPGTADRARARGRPARPVGRPGAGQEGQHRVRRREGRPRHASTRWRGELDDVELLHEMAREVDDASQEADIDAAIASIAAPARRARPAQPVHRRARRGRLHRADQRQGRRRRRAGLERDAAADVRPLGRAARLRLRGRRRSARAPRPASCRPSSRSPAATPTG